MSISNSLPKNRRPRVEPDGWDFPGRPERVLVDGGPDFQGVRLVVDGDDLGQIGRASEGK